MYVSRKVVRHPLTEASGSYLGYIRSSDLIFVPATHSAGPRIIGAATPTSRSIRGVAAANTLAAVANHAIPGLTHVAGLDDLVNTSKTGKEFATTDLYPKLLAALARSLAFTMSQEAHYLLLGNYTCVYLRTTNDQQLEQIGVNGPLDGTSLVTCGTRWLSSGTLIFTFQREAVPRLSSFQYMFQNKRGHDEMSVGASLLLSPSGLTGYFRSLEHTPQDHPLHNSRAAMKSLITTRLLSIGITLSHDVLWIWISFESFPNGLKTTLPMHPQPGSPLTLWPATLCLCEAPDPLACMQESDFLAGADLDGLVDPLERAQAWFMGRDARKAAIELKHNEEMAENQKLNDLEAREDDEGSSKVHLSQTITPRDVSGIYPTPPDGLPSALPDSSTNIDLQAGNIHEDTNATIAGAKDDASQQYKDRENDDLFGEIDMDVFATNGLTEADFSFFDEPDIPANDELGAEPDWEAGMLSTAVINQTSTTPVQLDETQELNVQQNRSSPESKPPQLGTLQDQGKLQRKWFR